MIDYSKIPSPCYVLEEERLIRNLQLLQKVKKEAGVSIILAFKGFAMWSVFPTVRNYLDGATASSLNEARLCNEEMRSKAHTYAVAYSDNEFDEIVSLSSHLTFNSLNQFNRFKDRVPGEVSMGLRVNPEWSDVKTDLYNPSSPVSRLGVTSEHLQHGVPEGIEGLHFHVLCESSSEALVTVLENLERKFEHILSKIKWVNMGGGHLITREGYDKDLLIRTLKRFKEKYQVKVILEPGSAVAWQTGDLKSTVLDIVENNGVKTAVMDISFTCHMPDCLEMPYKPKITSASEYTNKNYPFEYRIGGTSCLAGDFMEKYGFKNELEIGDTLIFEDMIHYTMVKTTTFNGVKHPSIGIWKSIGDFELIREFGYGDYRDRLS